MEASNKSIGFEGETSLRVSDDSLSWLYASRQRFTIELRPGETTIVSWKRLIKDAHTTTPLLTVQKIEDTLDECYQDDKSTIIQNGLLVNSEKLECINKPVLSVPQQSRKRSKNLVKVEGEKVDDHVHNKHAKVEQGKPSFAASNPLLEDQSSALLQNVAAKSEHDQKLHKLSSSQIRSFMKKSADTGTKSEYSSCTEISSNDASVSPLNVKNADKHTSITTHYNDIGNDINRGAAHQKNLENNSSKQLESPVRISIGNDEVGFFTEVEKREKRATCGELPDLNLPVYPMLPEKTPSIHSKNVSNLRPKGTMLERAIRELEKVASESKLGTMEVQDADVSSAANKRRLPREVKQKLAKVARLAQSSQGKISEELINRLMHILGHSVHLRTLKRNLRDMVLLGLSAKREKADKFQEIKMEVLEMIKLQSSMRREVGAGDFQEGLRSEGKVVFEEQYSMDNALEDKICDLYDIYVQGMDEDKGPQIRKLYVELAELWPNGIIDNHGIKSAIRRAKERRRQLSNYDKVREKDRRKKSAQKTEVGVRREASAISHLQAVQERQISESTGHVLALPCRVTSSSETMAQHLAATSEISKGSNMDNSKPEKMEKTMISSLKEPTKQQQEWELENRAKRLSLKLEKESRKSHKRGSGHQDTTGFESTAPPS